MYFIDELDHLLMEAGPLGKWQPMFSPRDRVRPVDLGGGLTNYSPDRPFEDVPLEPIRDDQFYYGIPGSQWKLMTPTQQQDVIGRHGILPRTPDDEQLFHGVPGSHWKYMSPDEQQAHISNMDRQDKLLNKLQQSVDSNRWADMYGLKTATPLPPGEKAYPGGNPVAKWPPAPPQNAVQPKLPPNAPPDTQAIVNQGGVDYYARPSEPISHEDGIGSNIRLGNTDLSQPTAGVRRQGDTWFDAEGNVITPPIPERPQRPEPELTPEQKKRQDQQRQYHRELSDYEDKIGEAVQASQSWASKIKALNAQARAYNTRHRHDPDFQPKEIQQIPVLMSLQDYHDWGFLPEIPQKPIPSWKKETEDTSALPDDFTREIPTIMTPKGELNIVQADMDAMKRGYIVYHSSDPTIPIDGPFETEEEARVALRETVREYAQKIARAFEAKNGQEMNDSQYARLIHDLEDDINIRGFEPPVKDMSYFWDEGEDDNRGRDYEYGKMREVQLQMLEKGLIDRVADDNPPGYRDDGHQPTYEEFKKVWCPFILDKANPPAKPWTYEEIRHAVVPLLRGLARGWQGEGAELDELMNEGYIALMQALINDRGKSPTFQYLKKYVWSAMRKYKKSGIGAVKRTRRGQGWGGQGTTSTSAEIGSAPDGMKATTVGDTIPNTAMTGGANGRVGKCPVCAGNGHAPWGEPETCVNCKGSGILPPTVKNPKGKTCSYCRSKSKNPPRNADGIALGTGKVWEPCNNCRGKGEVVYVNRKEFAGLERDDKGRLRTDNIALAASPYDINTAQDTSDEQMDPIDRWLKRDLQVFGAPTPDEGNEIKERLTDANRLILHLVKHADLSEGQKTILALRYGLPLPGFREWWADPMSVTELREFMANRVKNPDGSPRNVTTTVIKQNLDKIADKLRKAAQRIYGKDPDFDALWERYLEGGDIPDIYDVDPHNAKRFTGWGEKQRQMQGLPPLSGTLDKDDKQFVADLEVERNDLSTPYFKRNLPAKPVPTEEPVVPASRPSKPIKSAEYVPPLWAEPKTGEKEEVEGPLPMPIKERPTRPEQWNRKRYERVMESLVRLLERYEQLLIMDEVERGEIGDEILESIR